ncbi:2-phosphosulfolactate phosphatase [Paenibacillus sp. y28]|uniref:2-phosphosulfolactate phosphatase n=1 Tax=Paenibacillus sp. y28 TaxID=3129110 RepID=UPI0030170D13
MDIQIYQLLEGARQARGLTVIIDVFRAFSAACYALEGGVARIYPIGRQEEAYALKKDNPEFILVGERGGVMLPGFDYGNSPWQLQQAGRNGQLTGKTMVHTTSAGTQGIVGAQQADEIITGSFVNAGAIAQYIRTKQPQHVSLVCMGLGGEEEADEDTLCAEWIKAELEGRPGDFDAVIRQLRDERRTGSFLDLVGEASAPEEDFGLCLALNRFSFVLRAEREPGTDRLQLVRVSAE